MNGNTAPKQRNGFLDLLKMVSILMIIITHVSWTEAERSFFVFPFLIEMAVPVFMIISAYLRANKIEKIGFRAFISPKSSLKSLNSLLFAYLIVAGVEIAAACVLSGLDIGVSFAYIESPKQFILWFLMGLTGPGSYYMPVMVQLIVYYPLIWLLVRKLRGWGLAATFGINLVYDVLVYQFSMPADLYRLLIFRYTFLIGLGIYLSMASGKKRDDILAAACLVLGAFLIILNAYIRPFTLFQSWKSTSMLCVPFAYGAVYFLKKLFNHAPYRKIYVIGKASLHIYLTQMVFFAFGGGKILSNVFGFMPSILNGIAASVVAIAVCVPIGILFFFFEDKARALFKKKKQAS